MNSKLPDPEKRAVVNCNPSWYNGVTLCSFKSLIETVFRSYFNQLGTVGPFSTCLPSSTYYVLKVQLWTGKKKNVNFLLTSFYSSELSLLLICIRSPSCFLAETDSVGFLYPVALQRCHMRGWGVCGSWDVSWLLKDQAVPSSSAESFPGW